MSDMSRTMELFRASERKIEEPSSIISPPPTDHSAEIRALTVAGNLVEQLNTLPEMTKAQLNVAYWLACEAPPTEIAWRVGCSQAYVRMMRDDPRVVEMVKFFKGNKVYDFVEEISPTEILKRTAIVAAERLAQLMFEGSDATALGAIKEVLKITGHGAPEQDRIQVILGEGLLDLYKKSKDEARDAEFEIVGD